VRIVNVVHLQCSRARSLERISSSALQNWAADNDSRIRRKAQLFRDSVLVPVVSRFSGNATARVFEMRSEDFRAIVDRDRLANWASLAVHEEHHSAAPPNKNQGFTAKHGCSEGSLRLAGMMPFVNTSREMHGF
jgi:hypothetical protein